MMAPQNPMQLIQSIQQFARGFQGNPQQMVQQMIQSGRIPQSQLNQIQQQATQIYNMMGGGKQR